MKRETALRYAREIANRVHGVGGLIATPQCNREAVRISRMWVFGSTAKGSAAPNDLDLLIELREVGRMRMPARRRIAVADGMLSDGAIDRDYLRRFGIITSKKSRHQALIWLTAGMKKVSRHCTDSEGCAPFKEQRMIYPKWCL